MTLNEKFVSMYNEAAERVRKSDAYKERYDKIVAELGAYCKAGIKKPVKAEHLPGDVRCVLTDDLRREGLEVVVYNGGVWIEVSIVA